jgi:CRP-like cAMP-binding protein
MLDLSVAGIRERLLLLKALPNLQGLDEAAQAILASHTIERIFKPGDVLVRENQPLKAGYIVVEGMVHVRREGYVTARIDKGGVGFLSILAQDPRGVEAVAIEKSRTLELPVEALNTAYEENFSYMRNTLKLVASSLLSKRDSLPRRADEGEDAPMGEWYDRPKTLVEKIIDATTRAGIMSGMNLDAVIDWSRASREIRAEPGHRFWKTGDKGTHTLLIDYGRIRCSAEGRSCVVGTPYALGSLDPLCDRPRAYDAVADTKVIALAFDGDDWMTVIENHRRLGLNLLKALSVQLLRLQLEDAKREQGAVVTAA